MFLFLNRVMRMGVVGLWIAGGYWVWTQRDVGRPFLDFVLLLDAAGWKEPAALSTMEGTVTKVVTDTGVFVKDGEGKTWSFGLVGVYPTSQDPRLMEFVGETKTKLSEQLVNQPVRIAIVSVNAQRAGFGYLYPGTNGLGLAVEMISEGRWRFHEESARVLPLMEQVRLHAADRKARAREVGIWGQRSWTWNK